VIEPEFLRRTRDGYDRTAASYAERFHNHVDGKPVDRAMLAAFAGLVAQGGNIRVADVGCGTGSTTGMLQNLGVEAFGIDLSPEMVRQARQHNPHLGFEVGSMTDLNASDGSLGGVCAWYSIIHIPDEHLLTVFVGFSRVLTAGGWLLVAFQVGDQPRILAEAFDQKVDLCFHRRQPEHVEALLAESGLRPYSRLVRAPDDDGLESTPHAYLIARKPL
jgi:SAM-dependent methyltransferase